MRAVLGGAGLTGLFCAVFAFGIELVTNAVPLAAVLGLAFVSGFCGSLCAQLVLRQAGARGDEERKTL